MNSIPLGRDLLAHLSQTPLFAGLTEDDLRLLLDGAVVEAHPDGHVLFEAGAAAERFYVVLDGHVELVLEDGGRRSVVEVAKSPMVLGEAAMVGQGGYPTGGRVVGYARLLAVPAQPFLRALDGRFDLALRMLGSLSVRLRGLVGQITALKLKSTAQRLAGFLLGLTARSEGAAVVRFPYDKRLAAAHLGMTAESLSRALVRLAELGVESRAENQVAIADLAALRAFCAEESECP